MVRRRPHLVRRLCAALALAGLIEFVAGCAHVPVAQQRRISQTGMVFSDSPVVPHHPNLVGQIEPGAAVSGGAQAAGCTTCR